MTPKGVINMGISREDKGMIGVLLGKVRMFCAEWLPIYGHQKKEKSIDFSFFWCPGQDSNLHELMLTTPSK